MGRPFVVAHSLLSATSSTYSELLSPFVVAHSSSHICSLNLERLWPIHRRPIVVTCCHVFHRFASTISCLHLSSPVTHPFSPSVVSICHVCLHLHLPHHLPHLFVVAHLLLPSVASICHVILLFIVSPSATSSAFSSRQTPPIRCRPSVVAIRCLHLPRLLSPIRCRPSIVAICCLHLPRYPPIRCLSICHVIGLLLIIHLLSPSTTSSAYIRRSPFVSFRRVFLCQVVICLRLHVCLEVKGPGRFNARWRTTSNCECTLRQTWYRPFMEIRCTGGKSYFPAEEEYQDSF
jgi:hypothetical protein